MHLSSQSVDLWNKKRLPFGITEDSQLRLGVFFVPGATPCWVAPHLGIAKMTFAKNAPLARFLDASAPVLKEIRIAQRITSLDNYTRLITPQDYGSGVFL